MKVISEGPRRRECVEIRRANLKKTVLNRKDEHAKESRTFHQVKVNGKWVDADTIMRRTVKKRDR